MWLMLFGFCLVIVSGWQLGGHFLPGQSAPHRMVVAFLLSEIHPLEEISSSSLLPFSYAREDRYCLTFKNCIVIHYF